MYAARGGTVAVPRTRARRRRMTSEGERADYLRERREAEARLREAEERFRSAFEHAPVGMALIATEDGRLARVQRANPAVGEMLGLSTAELLTRTAASLFEPEAVEAVDRALAHVLEAEQRSAELDMRHVRPGGEVRWLAVSVSTLREQLGDEPTALLHVRDVTERRRSQEELERSEAVKAAILESALDCVVTIDAGGRVISFNPAAEATFGYAREEALGRDFAELMLPERDHPRHRSELASMCSGEESLMLNRRVELAGTRADGSEFPMELAVVPTGGEPPTFTGFMRDLSDRNRSAEVAARLAAIVESSDDAIIGKDLEGVITSWNPAAEALYGYSAGEAIGRRVDMLITDPVEFELVRRTVAEGRGVAPYETVRRRKDGSLVDVSVSVSPVFDDAGAVVGGAAIGRDITAQRESDRALGLSELRYRTLVSQLPDAAVYQYDRDFRIVAAEGALIELGGSTADQLVGRTLWELLPGGDADRFALYCGAALEGRLHSFEWRSLNGLILAIDVVPLRQSDDTIDGVMVLARDISERKRSERGLHFQAELLDRIDAAVVATDLDGRVTHWNRQAERFFDLRAAEAMGRDIGEINAALDVPTPDDLMQRLLAGETSHRLCQITRADGSVLPVLMTGAPVHGDGGAVVGFAGVSIDVTPARRAAAELHSARELFESAFESAPVGMALIRVDGEGRGTLTRVNHAIGRMLGSRPDALLGCALSQVLHPDEAIRIAPMLERLLAGHDADFHEQLRFRAACGETVWGNVSVSLIRGADGTPLHAVALVEDLTDARRAEAERVALEERLHRSQKLDGIGRLAGGIAHDFNNLLAVILSYSVLVAEELPAGRLRSDVEEIRDAAERAATLTRQLLVFGRREVVRPRPIDLNSILADTERLLRRTIGEDVDLRVSAEPRLWPVRADRSQIEQVVLNLAINSRDAMPDGGTLIIETSNAQESASSVVLTVRDDGAGMTPEVAERAFEPFFTTKPSTRGTGLGLASAYGIVTAAGGTIDLETAAGQGTTVRIVLPACFDPDVPEAPVADDAPAGGRGETVLVAEDDPAVRALVGRLLAEAGYRLVEAATSQQALELGRAGNVDLLLTDVVMPGMSGSELSAALADERPGLRVLFMSGYTDDVVMRHRARERRVAFLEKPFTRESLLRGVRDALDREGEVVA
jgi:PAS domain S-box-containing protein